MVDDPDVPSHTLPSNVAYVIRVGTIQSKVLMEWGCTSDFEELCASRREEHPGCQNVMIIDVGTHDSKVLESSMDEFVKDSHVHLCKPVSTHDRYFYGPEGEDDEEYFDRFQKYIETRFRSILRYITREGAGTVVYGGENAPHIHSDALRIERQKSHIETEKTKQEKERTKQKALDLEILKMQMAMKFPIPEYYRGSSKTGDERHQKSCIALLIW
jgi:hypothetical protein